MTYKDWLTTRTERIPGKCGGRLLFTGTSLAVAAVGHETDSLGAEYAVELYPYLSLEDATHAGRYYRELFR